MLVSASLAAQTQNGRVSWIFFRDKPETDLRISSAKELGISPRALWRRSKVLVSDKLFDELDIPVDQQYIEALKATGMEVRAVSRWLNAVSVRGSASLLATARSLPFVRSVAPVALFRRPPLEPLPLRRQSILLKTPTNSSLNYGSSLTQLANIQVPAVHDLLINGFGTIVGMVDDGYNNHLVHDATKNNTVLAEFDFIQGDSTTSIEPGENSGQGNHGMYTYSALSGFKEGTLIGPAYGASFLLAKTEVIGSETPIEEDYYVQGLEWLEQSGADLVSSSLGYIDWYTYDSLDGQTAVTTKAAKIATRKGVLLVTAMGNEGHFRSGSLTGTMIAPADADSILSVGATFSDGEIASFSSTGPTFDGRIKPEVVAQGVNVVSANGNTTSGYSFVNGTSLATPLVAGVAALIFSAHPELTPMQVREALIQTAVKINDTFDPSRTAVYPNNFYGNGLINAQAAVTYHGIAFSNKPMVTLAGSTLTIFVSIASNTGLVADSLCLYYQGFPGDAFHRAQLTPSQVASMFSVALPLNTDSTYPRGYFSARDNGNRTGVWPFNAPDSLFQLRQFIVSTVPGVNEIPTLFVLNPNFPNPFNSGTSITFDAPGAQTVELSVFNVLGQKIRTLFIGISTPGRNTIRWDGKDDAGKNSSTGVYFYQLRTPKSVISNKMVMIK
jgi:subtilisin family serine protease